MEKVNELSNINPILQCKIAWQDYPADMKANIIKPNHDYEVLEAANWIAFKSMLIRAQREGSLIVSSLFYEEGSRTIWFTTFEQGSYPNRYTVTTWFLQL